MKFESSLERFILDTIKEIGDLGGIDVKTEDFADTPKRVAQMWNDFIHTPKPEMKTFPTHNKQGMIVFRNHLSWGFCPHHMLPVKYTIHIGYIPQDRVLGGSKPLRYADWVTSRFPLQEDVPYLIVQGIEQSINPKGAGCIVHGEHNCMRIRGIKSPCASMITDFFSGCFLQEDATREEFLLLCQQR